MGIAKLTFDKGVKQVKEARKNGNDAVRN